MRTVYGVAVIGALSIVSVDPALEGGAPRAVVIEIVETIGVTDAPVITPPALIDVSEQIAVVDAPGVEPEVISFVVNTVQDADGGTCDVAHCTLREAIHAANATPVPTEIHFAIPEVGSASTVHTIQPTTALPVIGSRVLIDGFTQPGARPNVQPGLTNDPGQGTNAILLVVLDGSESAGAIGLRVAADDVTIRGLVVQGFSAGIALQGDGGRLEGSHIQNNATDGVFITGSGNTIGGASPADLNVISGNDVGVAIFPSATENRVMGNLIGTGRDGTTAHANRLDGVTVGGSRNLIGGTAPGEGNVIAPHTSNAVLVGWWGEGNPVPEANIVKGNTIGTTAAGSPAAGGQGVSITDAVGTLVGGPAPGAGNTIRGNGFNGVAISGPHSARNRVISNSISENGEIGIDLGGDGVTPNDGGDVDEGPNRLQNFPVVTNAAPGLGTVIVAGRLESTPGRRFLLQFFAGACDGSGHGEAPGLVGEASVLTDRLGVAEFNETFGEPVSIYSFVSATATDPDGNTSELSACRSAALNMLVSGEQEVVTSPLDDGGTLVSSSGGLLSSTVEVCRVTTLQLTDGDSLELRCGSAGIVVLEGPVEVRLDDNTEAVVPTGGVVTVEETEEGQLQLENESPEGSDPVLLSVEGTVVGEVATGTTLALATIHVDKAELEVDRRGRVGGKVELEGTFAAAVGDGIDVLAEDVLITLGPFVQTIPAGAFEADGRRGGFKYEADDEAGGVDEMRIGVDGSFKIEAEELDLAGLDLSAPVPFALRIGDDLASLALPFGADGELLAGLLAAGALPLDGPLRLTPDSVTVTSGGSAVFTVRLGGGAFAGRTVSLACEGLPAGAACAFDPPTVTPTAAGGVSTLRVTTTGRGVRAGGAAAGHLGPPVMPAVWLGALLAALIAGALLLRLPLARALAIHGRRAVLLPLALLAAAAILASACGDSLTEPSDTGFTPDGTHTFTVVATAGSEVHAVEATLIAKP